MKREVTPELLDELPSADLRAIQSRHDLQKVNALMGHARIMRRVLASAFSTRPPQTIIELGAGDGTLLLRLAKRTAPNWKPARVVLVDRKGLLSPETMAEFEALSWHVESLEMDVFEWLQQPQLEQSDLIIANLFLHHFTEENLRTLLRHASRQTGFFLACEPHRVGFSYFGAAMLGFIGCNGVTRHDAKASVRAGFAQNELSEMWPGGEGWRLAERRAGLFSHCFVAQRINGEHL